tara:strand:+ start:679 stop:1266 length:588 start_codon:yes stop_codon:yes gene_type:complete
MVTKDEVSELARSAISGVFAGLHKTKREADGKEWTRKITEELCAKGRGKSFRVCAHGQENGWGEWLYDVCWLEYGDEGSSNSSKYLVDAKLDFLKQAVLIVESEFGNLGDIRDDFQKLLVGRALVRCMIFDGRKPDGLEIAEWLSEMVNAFSATGPDDFYLLAAYTDQGFRYWHIDRHKGVEPVAVLSPKTGSLT